MATIRNREISACPVFQAQSYLRALYRDNMDTIIVNSDAALFLGGKEQTTLEEISKMLGKETIDSYNSSETKGNSPSFGKNYTKMRKELMTVDKLAIPDGGKCVLQLRGIKPFLNTKYEITRYPNYRYLADYDKRNTFDIERYLSTRMRAKPDDEFEVYEFDFKDAEPHPVAQPTVSCVHMGSGGVFVSPVTGNPGVFLQLNNTGGVGFISINNPVQRLGDKLITVLIESLIEPE